MLSFNGSNLGACWRARESGHGSWIGRADVGCAWGCEGIGGNGEDKAQVAMIAASQVGLDVGSVALELTA